MMRTIGLGVAVAVALVVPACSTGADLTVRQGPPPETTEAPAATESPTTTTEPPGATSIVTVPQVAPVGDAPAPAGCPPPFVPLASADVFAGSTERLPDVSGDDVLFQASPPGELPPGAPTFVSDEGAVGVRALPDLDGDGTGELLAHFHERRDGLLVPVAYLVHSSTPSGAHDPLEVGVRLAEAVVAVEDRNGDGIDDLVEVELDGGLTRVLSGAEVAEVDPGGDARAVRPLLVVPGDLLGFADLGGDHPVLVTGELVGQPTTSGVVHLADEQGTRRFTTDPEPWVINYSPSFAAPTVVTSEAGTYLSLGQSERHAARSYLWRVDDPCGSRP